MMTKEDYLQATLNFTNEFGFVPEIDELAKFLNQTQTEIELVFKSTEEIVVFYFELLFQEFNSEHESIPELNQLSFGESFSHLVFGCVDLLKSEPVFSKISLNIIKSGIFSNSLIQHLLRPHFEKLIMQDVAISTTSHVLIGDLFYNQMIRDWEEFTALNLNEKLSEDQWIERVDKFSKLMDSLLHNDLPEKGLDYLKTLYSQGLFSLKQLF